MFERLAAELASELPAHLRAYARAHAVGAPPPPAPAVCLRPSSLALARRAVADPALATEACAALRLLAPLAIEADPAVARARAAAPSWAALAGVTAARDAAARAAWGRAFAPLCALLAGAEPPAPGDGADDLAVAQAEVADWHAARGPALDAADVERAWRELAAAHGARGQLEIWPSAVASPRAFVVEPGRHVVVVVPAAIATPATRFALCHELGHAVAGLLSPVALPRALDEAVAARVAAALEDPAHAWFDPAATPARVRRDAIARLLARIEHGAPPPPGVRLPPALWDDPGAQAAYASAGALATELALPLAEAIAAHRAALDARLIAHVIAWRGGRDARPDV